MQRTRLGGRGGREASRRALRPSAEGLEARALLSTVQDFNGTGGTQFAVARAGQNPGPLLEDAPGSTTDRVLRLASAVAETSNLISFVQSDAGRFRTVDLAFDMRVSPRSGRGDGLGVALLNTAVYGTQGPVAPPGNVQEEPDFTGSFGLGFDLARGPQDASDNSVSVHFNGRKLADLPVPTGFVDLASGRVIRVQARLNLSNARSNLTLTLTPAGGSPVTVVQGLAVPGLQPYPSRAQFGARSGGEANIDVDNIRVDYGGALADAPFGFSASSYTVDEDAGFVDVRVVRSGNEQAAEAVRVATVDGSAAAGRDYTPFSGTVTFAADETSKTVRIPIRDDATAGADRSFTVVLSSGQSGPSQQRATVTIVDDETAAVPPTVAPTARALHRDLSGSALRFEVTFSKPMAATVTDPSRYQVLVLSPRPGGRPRAVPITGVTYDAARRVATLTVAERNLPAARLRIVARGDGPLALRDNAGNALDGNRDGRPGGDAVLTVR